MTEGNSKKYHFHNKTKTLNMCSWSVLKATQELVLTDALGSKSHKVHKIIWLQV